MSKLLKPNLRIERSIIYPHITFFSQKKLFNFNERCM